MTAKADKDTTIAGTRLEARCRAASGCLSPCVSLSGVSATYVPYVSAQSRDFSSPPIRKTKRAVAWTIQRRLSRDCPTKFSLNHGLVWLTISYSQPSRRRGTCGAHVDDHWRSRRAPELEVVPVATWPGGDGSCPRLLRANRRLGWNGLALSPDGCRLHDVEELPVLIDQRLVGIKVRRRNFEFIGPSDFGRKGIREILVCTHDVDARKVECLSWQVRKPLIRIDLAAPLAQDRLEMAQCVVVGIECIRLFFRKCDRLRHCRRRETRIARRREEDSESENCPGDMPSYRHGSFPDAYGFNACIDRKQQSRCLKAYSNRFLGSADAVARAVCALLPH